MGSASHHQTIIGTTGDALTDAGRQAWQVTPSPVAPEASAVEQRETHVRVALAEAADARDATRALLMASCATADSSWPSAITMVELYPDGRGRVACIQSPPVLLMSATTISWISPLLLGPQGFPGECRMDPGDRLLAMTPSCVAHLDPRLLRMLARQAPRTRSADDLADLLITRVNTEGLSGWRRQCAYGFVIVTRTAG